MGRVGVNVGGLVKGSSSMLPATIHWYELTILVNAWQIFFGIFCCINLFVKEKIHIDVTTQNAI